MKNSAAYIQSWSSKLIEDQRLFVHASSQAEKAVKFILGIEDEREEDVTPSTTEAVTVA